MATPRSRIAKGRSFQRLIKQKIQECFSLTDDDIRCAIGAENGPDVILCNEVTRQKVGLGIECKNVQNLSIWSALEQAKAHAKSGGLEPALIFHRSRAGNTEHWITVPLDHYLKLREGK